MTLEFTKEFGALPSINVATTTGATVTTTKTQTGTKEEVMCGRQHVGHAKVMPGIPPPKQTARTTS